MTSTSLSSQLDFVSQIVIDIDPDRLANIETKAEQKMPNFTAKHNYILNSLTIDGVKQWLEENITEENESVIIPEAEYLNSCWSVVSGTPLALESMKIVAIPSETIDTSGISIPREWVDIPQWIPDYFIAARVDLQQKKVLLWGYVHADTVKQQGTLDRTHQNYILSQDRMSLDLELFGITEPFINKPQTKQKQPLHREVNLEAILKQLSLSSAYSPRLDLPFEIWSALISDKRWLKKLYQQRCLNSTTNNSATNLLQWLQKDVVEPIKSGWQELSELFSANFTQTPQPAFASRDESSQKEKWAKKAKVIDLKVQLDSSIPIILLVAIAPRLAESEIAQKAKDKYSIMVQLHPESGRKFLPESINLSLLSDAKLLQEAVSRSQDSYLQLGFTCPIETSFEIKVTYREKVYFQEVFFFE